MIYVFRRASSTGARELAEALGGKRFRGRIRPIQQQAKPGDVVVCWGEALDPIPGVKVLNGTPIQNKYQDALMLKAAGVPTIEVSQTKPVIQAEGNDLAKPAWEEAIEAAEDFIEIPFALQNPVFKQGIQEFSALLVKLQQELNKPPLPKAEWLGRLYSHVGGDDLLEPPAQPEFYARKESITEEVRIHSFNGKSIRAGKKMSRPNMQQHPWVRSFDGGWFISYDNFESRKEQRELAASAVKALKLDFGAVDLGKLASGKWIVLEVNRAAGIEGGTVASYTTAIQNWIAA